MIFQQSPKRSSQKIIKLSARDVEDAKRLLSLVSEEDDLAGDSCIDHVLPKQAAILLQKAREILANRRRRYESFGNAMFGEPAWDILLLVYVLRAGQRPTIGRLADLSGATKSTALRWIDYL